MLLLYDSQLTELCVSLVEPLGGVLDPLGDAPVVPLPALPKPTQPTSLNLHGINLIIFMDMYMIFRFKFV